MNEEIEYAEMLEIPVSTVNVVKKKNRRVRGKNQPNLKERLISRVNNRVGNASYAPEDAAIESAPASALEQNPVYASAKMPRSRTRHQKRAPRRTRFRRLRLRRGRRTSGHRSFVRRRRQAREKEAALVCGQGAA